LYQKRIKNKANLFEIEVKNVLKRKKEVRNSKFDQKEFKFKEKSSKLNQKEFIKIESKSYKKEKIN
jgi:hypothetical protein